MRIGSTLFITLGLLALSITALTAASSIQLSQKGRAFSLPSLQILRGQTVHIDNEDQFVHQIYVESPAFTFESNEQEPGTSVELQFSKTGLFEVRCHIHPKMLLKVDVQ